MAVIKARQRGIVIKKAEFYNPVVIGAASGHSKSVTLSKETMMYMIEVYQGLDNVTEGDIEDYIEDIQENAQHELVKGFKHSTIECRLGYLHLVDAEHVVEVCVERLEEDDYEYLGGFNTELVQKCFREVGGHTITGAILEALYNNVNYHEIGVLMANTKGILPKLVEVIVEKHDIKTVLSDIVMGGEKCYETVIDNRKIYFGGY